MLISAYLTYWRKFLSRGRAFFYNDFGSLLLSILICFLFFLFSKRIERPVLLSTFLTFRRGFLAEDVVTEGLNNLCRRLCVFRVYFCLGHCYLPDLVILLFCPIHCNQGSVYSFLIVTA